MISKKKILILGGNYTEIDIVNRAKLLGYYTIVTDNHENWSLSPAKKIADEGWDISWADIDILEMECRRHNVNGVLAGFSEFRVEAMIKLCERLELPASLTMRQLDITRNKILFKETCRKYGIPTVQEYEYNEVNYFPVIIKPVDRAGSIGINVAHDRDELKKYYQYALSLSPSKKVIIEDFLTEGVKFDIYYYVQNSKPCFLGSSDTIMCKGEKGAKILQKCWPFNSKYENIYRQNLETKIKEMFRGLGINNAYATMSAFYLNGEFYFFEAGFRLSGEMSYNYYEAISGINYIDSMLKFSLNEPYSTTFYEKNGKKYSAILNFFVIDGVVSEIKGGDFLKDHPSIYDTQLYIENGDEIKNSTNVFKKGAMITIIADSQASLISTISEVNNHFDIIKDNGDSMIYEYVTEREIIDYYKI